jgi:hypothetical protein
MLYIYLTIYLDCDSKQNYDLYNYHQLIYKNLFNLCWNRSYIDVFTIILVRSFLNNTANLRLIELKDLTNLNYIDMKQLRKYCNVFPLRTIDLNNYIFNLIKHHPKLLYPLEHFAFIFIILVNI